MLGHWRQYKIFASNSANYVYSRLHEISKIDFYRGLDIENRFTVISHQTDIKVRSFK